MRSFAFTIEEEDLERIATAVASRIAPPPDRQWYTVPQAASYTGLSKDGIRAALKRGSLEGSKGASGRVAFTRSQLDAFMGDAGE